MKHIRGLLQSFRYAFAGIWHCIYSERNFRVHILASITVVLISPYYNFTLSEMVKLMLVIFLVLITEMINTSIEEAVNLITSTYHEKAKIIKDVAAGAVAMAALCAVIVAGLMLMRIEVLINIYNSIISEPLMLGGFLAYMAAGTIFVFLPKKERNTNSKLKR